jgi:hypothetical protein
MWLNRQIDKLARWLLAPGNHWRWLAHILEVGFVLLLATLIWSIVRSSR